MRKTRRPRFGMRTYLVALALALLAPSLALGAVVAWQAVEAYRDAFEGRLEDTARALALAVDQEIGTYKGAMAALSSSMALDGSNPDLATFEIEARRAASLLDTSVVLLDATSLRQLINTSLPPGAHLGRQAAAEFGIAARTGRPMVTNLVSVAEAQRPMIGVAVPVQRDGQFPFILAARLEPGQLSGLLEAQNLQGGPLAAAIDSNGIIAARSRDYERFVGEQAPAWFMEGVARGDERFLQGPALEGPEMVVAYAPLNSAAGWKVVVAEPLVAYLESWRRPLEALAVGGALIIGLGAALALGLARHLLRPVAALAHDARAFAAAGSDEEMPQPSAPPSNVEEFEELRRGFVTANAALRARAAAKREADERQVLLMREVDHRAKNALSVALSLVRLAPQDVPPEQFAASVEGRIAAMARAHALLAKSAWSGADLRVVAEAELAPYAGRVVLAGPHAPLSADAVQPLSMLLHELATNAAKHGALSVPDGQVKLVWSPEPAQKTLRVSWEEVGGPTVRGAPNRFGFGTQMIDGLARQLDGQLEFDWRDSGLLCSLSLPERQTSLDVIGQPCETSGVGKGGSPTSKEAASPSVARAPGAPPRVLVVEDEILLALELEAALRELGCEVVGPVDNLAEALELAAREPKLHAAILDVNLGGQERSFQVADLLETRGVPVVFATGYAGADPLAGRESKAVAVLRKPYGHKVLADAISRAVGARDLSG